MTLTSLMSTVAANYPFICPYCVKSLVSSVSVLTSDITQLKDRLVKLENTCKPMSTIIPEIKAVQLTLSLTKYKCYPALLSVLFPFLHLLSPAFLQLPLSLYYHYL